MRHPMQDRQTLNWLNRTLPKIKFFILALVLLRVSFELISVFYALSLRDIIDHALAGDKAALIRSIVLMFGLAVLQFVSRAVGLWLEEHARSTAENQLKSALLGNLLNRDYGAVTSVHSGEWINRMTSDTVVIANAVIQIAPGAASMAARVAAAAWIMYTLVPNFTVVLLLGALLITLSTLWMRKLLKRLHRQIQERDGSLRVYLTERLGSLIILKAYQQEKAAQAQADELMGRHKAARMKKNHFSNFCNSGFSLAVNSAYILSVAYCSFSILRGTLSYGTLTAILHLVNQLQSPMAGLTSFIPQYYAMLASAERLMEAERLPRDGEQSPAEDLTSFCGFGLRDLSFSYPNSGQDHAGSVRHLSFHMEQGEYAAFTGPSGCGKSTVLKLLLGLYAPDAGALYVSTKSGELPLTRAWSRLFAYVPQGNHLMSGTIREVVAFARPEQADDDAALLRALEIACARDFVEALPQGLDTRLGERGSGLSEGQMQRLAVARALFSDRPVLLLDEATSALDGPSEVQLLQNIRALTGKTVLIVTHRPAALEVVDKILFFSEEGVEVRQPQTAETVSADEEE